LLFIRCSPALSQNTTIVLEKLYINLKHGFFVLYYFFFRVDRGEHLYILCNVIKVMMLILASSSLLYILFTCNLFYESLYYLCCCTYVSYYIIIYRRVQLKIEIGVVRSCYDFRVCVLYVFLICIIYTFRFLDDPILFCTYLFVFNLFSLFLYSSNFL